MTTAAITPRETRDPLAAARELAPEVHARAAEIEAGRRVPLDLIQRMSDAGLFHLLVPESLGGSQHDPITAARVVEAIALADASAGWVTMLAHQNSYLAGFLPEAEARLIWRDDGNVAGTARPIGRATVTEGPNGLGYVVTGRWPFASGSSHATWFAGECVIYDGDEPRRDAAGEQMGITVFVPRSEVTVHDTWDTTGLRGTASNDFSIERALVPATRAFRVLVDPPQHPWALYRALPLVFMNHGAHALGVAQAALDDARALFLEKRGWGGTAMWEQPQVQAALAEATASVEAARSYLYGTAEQLWTAAQLGEHTPEQTSRLRLATSHAATSSLQAIDLLHRTLATSAIQVGAPLERQFRDIHTAAAHVMVGPRTYEAAGRVALGKEAAFPYF
jgi:alkylation response protein AidB-like acyl-CoA dehydrogenase